MKAVYLASPFGFSEAGRSFYYEKLVPEIRAGNLNILDPWTLTDQREIDAVKRLPFGEQRRDAWRRVNFVIGQNNEAALGSCDAVLAVLDGADVDAGTAAEIGYAYARNKPVVGYRSDFRMSGDNEGAIVNPQIEYFIARSGGLIVSHLEDLRPALRRVLKC